MSRRSLDTRLPDDLAALLDRAAAEKQRLTWETLQQYAKAYDLALELLVTRAWGRRFPYIELLEAGVPQQKLAEYEHNWSQRTAIDQTRCLEQAFSYAAARSARRRRAEHE